MCAMKSMLVKSLRCKFREKERRWTLEGSLRIARSHEAVDRRMKRIVSNAGAVRLNIAVDASV